MTSKAVFSSGATRSEKLPRFELVEFILVERVAVVMTLGAVKYGEHNWQKGGSDFMTDIPRHIIKHAWMKINGDIGEDHLAHIACNAMMLMWLEKNSKK